MRTLWIVFCLVITVATADLRAQIPNVAPNPELKRLEFLIGTWDLEGVGLNRKGEVVHHSKGHVESRRAIGGLLITTEGYAHDGRLAVTNWKFFHEKKHKLYDVQFDLAGNFEVREALSVGEDLGFSLIEPFVGEDGVPRDWRKTYRNIDSDSYDIETHYTEDGGKTWVLAFREHFARRSR